jgi:pyridoxal phosphate enzyme (YggS family)
VTSIAERLGQVRRAVAAAARQAGRDPEEIRIIAASKYADVAMIQEAADAGQRDFGENYLQQALAKMRALDRTDIRWHFIGGLQSNKAAKAARAFHLIHTLSSESALQALARALRADAGSCRVLVQVRLGAAGRPGVEPAQTAALVRAAAAVPSMIVDGLMGMAPLGEPPRPHFARLREILEDLRALDLPQAPLREMSAGISEDFEDAIREGATMVRIGRSLFGRARAVE